MTTLTITPDIAKKKLKLAGTVASGEKVAVTIAGFGTVATENLRLRVMAGDVPVGYFPLENEDAWTVSGADLACTLNLATWQAERHCKFGAEVCFILEDTGTPQLYGVGDFSLRPWIKLSGVDVPKNLDNYKVRMDALLAEINRVEGVANGKYTKPETGIPKTDLAPSVRTSLDKADAVTLKVSKSAFDTLLGLSLPDSATQKDTRQIVQRILTVLQNAATCIALMVALPVFGIDGTTAWEDVPPDRTVKSVVEQFSPPADFSTNNTDLVETIQTKVTTATNDVSVSIKSEISDSINEKVSTNDFHTVVTNLEDRISHAIAPSDYDSVKAQVRTNTTAIANKADLHIDEVLEDYWMVSSRSGSLDGAKLEGGPGWWSCADTDHRPSIILSYNNNVWSYYDSAYISTAYTNASENATNLYFTTGFASYSNTVHLTRYIIARPSEVVYSAAYADDKAAIQSAMSNKVDRFEFVLTPTNWTYRAVLSESRMWKTDEHTWHDESDVIYPGQGQLQCDLTFADPGTWTYHLYWENIDGWNPPETNTVERTISTGNLLDSPVVVGTHKFYRIQEECIVITNKVVYSDSVDGILLSAVMSIDTNATANVETMWKFFLDLRKSLDDMRGGNK